MFERYHIEEKVQYCVRVMLSDRLPYVGNSADWINDAWELYSDDSGDFVLLENDNPFSYSVYSRDYSGDFVTEIQRFQYHCCDYAEEIVKDLIHSTQKYRGV